MRTAMAVLLALAAGMLVAAGAASAQVAAPRLTPVAIESDSPINPAVLSWAHNSILAGAYVDASVEVTPSGGTAQEAASGSGLMLQGRYVGEMFAVGGEAFDVENDVEPAIGGGTQESRSSWVGLSAQFGGVLSLGVGQQRIEQTVSGNTGGDNARETTLPMAGISVRLAEVFYIGAAMGDQTFSFEEPNAFPPSPASGEAERGVTRLGVGFAMRDGSSGVHLEVYREEVDEIVEPTWSRGKLESDGLTAEVVFADMLLAVEQLKEDRFRSGSGQVSETREQSTVSIGWVPLEGLTLVAAIGETEFEDLDPASGSFGQIISIDALAFGLGWGF